MNQEHVRLSFLVLLSLFFCASQACQKRAISPGGAGFPVSPGKAAAGESPTPEEARSALVELVETFDFQNLDLSKEIVEKLKSKESIEELKSAKNLRSEGDRAYIGGWSCNLSKKRFAKLLERTRANEVALEGRFELGSDGRWKAVATASSLADFAPR
jgi:hypothetical protein